MMLFADEAGFCLHPKLGRIRVDEFLSMHKRLRIDYIPKYHPKLNPQENLWRLMRYEETTDTCCETFEELIMSVFHPLSNVETAKDTLNMSFYLRRCL
jgi:transposase